MIVEHDIEWTDERVARIWDYYARTGTPYFSDLHGAEIIRESRVPLGKPLQMLDFGSGPGFIWSHLRRLGARWHYTGVDFSASSIAELRKKTAGDPLFDDALLVERLPTPLASDSFDVTFLIEVIEHLNDDHLHQTLTEIARVLRPGGLLVVSTPNDERLADAVKFCPECAAKFHEWQHVRSWTAASMAAHLAPYGFTLKHAKAMNMSAVGLLHRSVDLARRIVRKRRPPHLIAVFEATR